MEITTMEKCKIIIEIFTKEIMTLPLKINYFSHTIILDKIDRIIHPDKFIMNNVIFKTSNSVYFYVDNDCFSKNYTIIGKMDMTDYQKYKDTEINLFIKRSHEMHSEYPEEYPNEYPPRW